MKLPVNAEQFEEVFLIFLFTSLKNLQKAFLSLQNRLHVLDVSSASTFIPVYEDPCIKGAGRLKHTLVSLHIRKIHILYTVHQWDILKGDREDAGEAERPPCCWGGWSEGQTRVGVCGHWGPHLRAWHQLHDECEAAAEALEVKSHRHSRLLAPGSQLQRC